MIARSPDKRKQWHGPGWGQQQVVWQDWLLYLVCGVSRRAGAQLFGLSIN